MDTVLALGELLLILCAFLAAGRLHEEQRRTPSRGIPVAAIGLWLLVAVPSILQGVFPALLTALERNPDKIEHHAQLWRMLTSALVQDGGVAGTVSNLVLLAAIAFTSVKVLGPRLMWAVFGVGVLVFNLVSLAFGAAGAGNSGATLTLGSALTGLALARGRSPITRIIGALPAVPGVILVAGANPHGYALVVGTLIGVLLGRRAPQLADIYAH